MFDKAKLSHVWDVDISLKYLKRIEDNTLLTNIILTQKLIVLQYCLERPGFSTIFMFSVGNDFQ